VGLKDVDVAEVAQLMRIGTIRRRRVKIIQKAFWA
jgi:hypothetical protein